MVIKQYRILFICLIMSASDVLLGMQSSTRLQKYKEYYGTFLKVNNVPQEFNDNCLKELDRCPEDVPETNYNFYFQVAAEYGAMSVYHPERSQDCERIKRYYQTIVSQAFENKIGVIQARVQVNKDLMLLGYVYYGQKDKSISLQEWQVKWREIKQKVGPGGGVEELSK